MLTCRIREDSRFGRGFNVQVFDDERLTFAWRCPRESHARFVAASLRRDHLRAGWKEVRLCAT